MHFQIEFWKDDFHPINYDLFDQKNSSIILSETLCIYNQPLSGDMTILIENHILTFLKEKLKLTFYPALSCCHYGCQILQPIINFEDSQINQEGEGGLFCFRFHTEKLWKNSSCIGYLHAIYMFSSLNPKLEVLKPNTKFFWH